MKSIDNNIAEVEVKLASDDELEAMVINTMATTHRSAAPTPCPGC